MGGHVCPPLSKYYSLHIYDYCCTGKLVNDTLVVSACFYPFNIPTPPPGTCAITAVPCPACDGGSGGDGDGAGAGDACDGLGAGDAERADEGCGDDEEGCGGRDRDENPVRFDGGSVESQVHTLATIPGNGALGLEYAVQYQSRQTRRPGGVGVAADFFQDHHFLGYGWSDSYSDRLIVPASAGEPAVWMSLDRTVSFDPADDGDSDGGRFHLTDRGAGQSPRWVIESRERGAPLSRWEFADASPELAGPRRGLLSARAAAGFRIEVARASATDSRITAVTDSLGRRLSFDYLPSSSTNGVWRLAQVTYRAVPGTAGTVIAQFSYGASHRLLEITTTARYLRFNYLEEYPTPCAHCGALLTEIIAPTSADGATPLAGSPVQGHERVLEGHVFTILPDGTPRAVESWSPTTHWAYQYTGTEARLQLDLLLPKGACQAGGCAGGQACRTTASDTAGTCYVANLRDLIDGSVWNVDRGGLPDENESYIYEGDTPIATYSRGVITSYRFNDDGTIKCLVRNDDDTEALDTTGACAGPASPSPSQVLAPSWDGVPGGPAVHTVTLPSALVPFTTRATTDSYDARGLLERHDRFGWTLDRAGVTWPRTETSTYTYDSLGRLVTIDGPLPNEDGYDVTETTYHTSGVDLGPVRYTRRYAGSLWSHRTFTTEYSAYDLRGIPHRIVAADGIETHLDTADGLTWTVTEDATGSPATSTIQLNPDGSTRSQMDADGICLTYQDDAASGLLITKRSDASACGVVPIDLDSGDVVVIKHPHGDPSRTLWIEHRRDGEVVRYLDGFRYDDGRRLVGVTGANVSGEFVTTYSNALMSQVTSPGGPTAGAWSTQIEADELARPTVLRRLLGDGSAAVARLLYDTGWDGTPTQVMRGKDAAIAQVSSFRYDDFDRLVEATTPDAGTTRWEHDGAGRRIFERVGIGTPDQQTTQTTYDSLGRVLTIDRDADANTACWSAPNGTPLADESFTYDECGWEYHPDPAFTCQHPLGRLAVARRDLHCQDGQTATEVRWYQYDRRGRLVGSRTTQRTGLAFDHDTGMDYTWTSGDRLAGYAVTGTDQGTHYTYSKTGSVIAVSGSDKAPIASQVAYTVAGSLAGYQLVEAKGAPYAQLVREYDSQGMLRRHAWVAPDATAWQDQSFTYNDAGMLTSVTDDVAPTRGRRYEYDQLVRLTCELAGAPATSGACATTNPAVIGRFTYHDGASTAAPPDHRATAFTRTPDHVSATPEARTYAASTNRVASVQRGSDSLIITYDGLGRRTADYLASQPPTSRRAYTYLPDGQLHTITTAGGTVTLSYGIGGALSAIDGPEGHQDLTYDDAGRLVAALVEQSGTSIAWEYHYLGDTPIAATRRGDFGTERLGFLHDRRGLIGHVVDTTGKTLYAATHDAAGIATIDDEERLLWLPFALPGQLRLDGTGAPGRGPLFANGARAYDPDLGIFLAPDPADPIARVVPEGYAYARNNPIHFADPSGGAAWGYWDTDQHPFWGPERTFFVEGGCDAPRAQLVRTALREAITAIATCTDGACGPLGGTALRARWLYALSVGAYACENDETHIAAFGSLGYEFVNGELPGHGPAFTDSVTEAANKHRDGLLRQKITYLGANAFPKCLAGLLAHEALHQTLLSLDASELHAPERSGLVEVLLANAARVDINRINRADTASGAVERSYPGNTFPQFGPSEHKQPDERYIKNAVTKCNLCEP